MHISLGQHRNGNKMLGFGFRKLWERIIFLEGILGWIQTSIDEGTLTGIYETVYYWDIIPFTSFTECFVKQYEDF